ncbi:glycosyltransferase [bacterium]|nr:glycosyltransferase [bacterium]NUN46805.1 glycosyltransferase [bacterium]
MPTFFSERVGGVEIQTYLLATHLSKLGWKVDFVSETYDVSKIGSSEIFDGVTIHWVSKKNHFSFWRRDIQKLVRLIKPDYIYQRGRSRFTSSPIGIKATKKLKAKLIYHCAEDNDFVRNFNFRQVHQSEKPLFKKIILGFEALLSDYYFHRTIQQSHLIIAQTESQKLQFKCFFNKDATIIRSAHELPSETREKSNPPMIFWIANTGKRKQPEKFIELAMLLKDTPYRFVMAGPIPDKTYEKEIMKMLSETPNIEYVGPISWDESNRYFAMATYFVNTTLAGREGFPNTYIQAWMRGTAVLTLHCDPDGLIEKHEIGYKTESLQSLAVWLRAQLDAPEKILLMRARAIKYGCEHHDIQKSSTIFSDLLQ